MSKSKDKSIVPKRMDLVEPVYKAFKTLGNQLNIDTIYSFVIEDLHISEEVLLILQVNKEPETELHYNIKWTLTDMGKAQILLHNYRNNWSIMPIYREFSTLDTDDIERVRWVKQKKQEQCPSQASFGVNLKGILKLMDISVSHLSEISGFKQKQIDDWIHMRKFIQPAEIPIICEALSISPYYLLIGDKEKYGNTEQINKLDILFYSLAEDNRKLLLDVAKALSKN